MQTGLNEYDKDVNIFKSFLKMYFYLIQPFCYISLEESCLELGIICNPDKRTRVDIHLDVFLVQREPRKKDGEIDRKKESRLTCQICVCVQSFKYFHTFYTNIFIINIYFRLNGVSCYMIWRCNCF